MSSWGGILISTERSDWSILRADVIGERAKRARHYQGCTNLSWCSTYIYVYVYVYIYMYGGTYVIIVAHVPHT